MDTFINLTMSPTDNSDEAPPGAVTSKPSRNGCRGSAYTKTEDLLICKAFIQRSEDPIVGNSQKGKDFKEGMHHDYKDLIARRLVRDANIFASSSAATREAYGQVGCNSLYPERTADSIFSRFKDTISPRVMKFIGIEETLPRQSGSCPEDHYTACRTVYAKRFPRHGNFDDFRECKVYLETKAKFSSFRTRMVEDNEKASSKAISVENERPVGNKAAKQASKDAKLIQDALSFMNKSPATIGARSTIAAVPLVETKQEAFFNNASTLMDKLGTALLSHLESEALTESECLF